ncbi:hypothetical protein [Sphingomonas sp. GC_Shp_3]|uniref:hypothetical protein n=1 Tax=Sphingomonas sp. GC_Shp_3 TaxID=2937383 RepID=UPI002269EEE6|nr:hypothetical protein [Sphingomonas sp. GC_Shp_3]
MQNVICQFALCLLGAITPSYSAAVSSIPAMSPQSSQLETLVFNGTYPAKSYEFTGNSARHLAKEVMPVIMKDITRATVSEDVLLPTPTYNGFTIDMTFTVTTNDENTVCEECHAILHFSPDDQQSHKKDVHVKVENGTVVGHSLSSFYWKNRYFSLPSVNHSRQAALQKCQSFSNDSVLWNEAVDISIYLVSIRRADKLKNAIERLPPSAITFSSIEKVACKYDKNKLLSIMRPTRIERSESVIVPTEGEWSVFYRQGLNDDLNADFVATLHSDEAGQPLTLHIRCSQSLPSPAI